MRSLRIAFTLLVLGTLAVASGGTLPGHAAPQHRYSVKSWGSIPAVQQVGQHLWAHVFYRNTGQTIRTPILDLSGCTDHWVFNGLGTTFGGVIQKSSNGNYYRLHALPHGRTMHVWILLVPEDSGNHNCDIMLFPDWDRGTQLPLSDPLSALSGSVAINP